MSKKITNNNSKSVNKNSKKDVFAQKRELYVKIGIAIIVMVVLFTIVICFIKTSNKNVSNSNNVNNNVDNMNNVENDVDGTMENVGDEGGNIKIEDIKPVTKEIPPDKVYNIEEEDIKPIEPIGID